MLKKYGDQRFIGASLGSATGGVPQNDRAFASLSIATQSAEYTTCAKTSPLKNPLPQVASSSANGLLAAISPAALPAVFSFCTRSRATNPTRRRARSKPELLQPGWQLGSKLAHKFQCFLHLRV